jgi:hypothetical protein
MACRQILKEHKMGRWEDGVGRLLPAAEKNTACCYRLEKQHVVMGPKRDQTKQIVACSNLCGKF